MDKQYCIYILTNKTNRILYTGVTGNLKSRVYQHKEKAADGFTRRYNITKLVYYEIFDDAYTAISREKQIKAGSRKTKLELIKKFNPVLRDLYQDI